MIEDTGNQKIEVLGDQSSPGIPAKSPLRTSELLQFPSALITVVPLIELGFSRLVIQFVKDFDFGSSASGAREIGNRSRSLALLVYYATRGETTRDRDNGEECYRSAR